MQSLPVFVISLKSATERRALIEEHLRGLGIDYEFIDAVKGDELQPGYRREINPAGNMSPGALGCYLSHVHVYERMIEQSIPVALILEDDTVLHYSVKTLTENGCRRLDFDYCLLGSDDRGDEGYVFYESETSLDLDGHHKAYLLSSGPFCLNAYLITLDGAKKRMSCAFPARTAIDQYHFLPYRPRFMATIPMLAFVNEQSAIGSMSSVNWSGIQARMRKHWWYYPLRDIAKLNGLKKLLALRRMKISHSGHWRSFASAFKVVPRRQIAKK